MKLSYTQTVLLCLLPILTSAQDSEHGAHAAHAAAHQRRQTPVCIQDSQVQGIASRWLGAFATGGISTLDSAVTEGITIYDEGANNGTTTAYVTGRQALYNNINAGPYGGPGVTDVSYTIVFTFHTCTQIALRWQQNEVTTSNIGYGSKVAAGKSISFKGTDLLLIDVTVMKVATVVTSADLLNDYRALGYNLGVLSS